MRHWAFVRWLSGVIGPVAIILLLGSPSVWGAGATTPPSVLSDLLTNGSFEVDADANFLPDFWVGKLLVLSASADGRNCTDSIDGACQMRMVGNGTRKRLRQNIKFDGVADSDLLLTFWAQTVNAVAPGKNRVKVILWNTDGTKEKFTINLSEGTTTWTQFDLPIHAPKNFWKIRVQLEFGMTGGEADYDDFVLAEV